MIKNDAKSIAALALAALVTHGVAPKWCGWVMKGTLGDWLQKIYDFLTEYAYVRCALAGIVVLCGIRLAWRVFRDKDFRWYRPVLLVWMYVLLYDQNNLDFVSVWNGLTFKGLANTTRRARSPETPRRAGPQRAENRRIRPRHCNSMRR